MINRSTKYYQLVRYRIRNPWAQHLHSARARCKYKNISYASYRKKNIKCYLTMIDIRKLWLRDSAYLLERPSLDRKNVNKNYTYRNCRFIEYKDNAMQGSINSAALSGVPVNKYNIKNRLIAKFKNLVFAAESVGDKSFKHNIWKCCNGKRLTAYGYIWRYQ